MLTLLVNAPTTGPIVRKLGLTRVPLVELKALTNIKAQLRRKAMLEFKAMRVLFEWDTHEESKSWQQWVVGKLTPLGGGNHGSSATLTNGQSPEATRRAQESGSGDAQEQAPGAFAQVALLAEPLIGDASLSGSMLDIAHTEAEAPASKKGLKRFSVAASKVRHLAASHLPRQPGCTPRSDSHHGLH